MKLSNFEELQELINTRNKLLITRQQTSDFKGKAGDSKSCYLTEFYNGEFYNGTGGQTISMASLGLNKAVSNAIYQILSDKLSDVEYQIELIGVDLDS